MAHSLSSLVAAHTKNKKVSISATRSHLIILGIASTQQRRKAQILFNGLFFSNETQSVQTLSSKMPHCVVGRIQFGTRRCQFQGAFCIWREEEDKMRGRELEAKQKAVPSYTAMQCMQRNAWRTLADSQPVTLCTTPATTNHQ